MENSNNNIPKIKGHSAMFGAEVMWGVSSPLGKMIMLGGISPLLLTDCRIIGAAILFWILSFFTKAEKVDHKDLLSMFFASLLGIVFNQCCFIWGLSLTSPINASIITTSMPIITMVLAALVLGEPVTKLKIGGVFLGAVGALTLILGSHSGGGGGSWAGDLRVIMAQTSFSCYLVFYKGLISKYRPVTLMKWMFTYASICVIPFTYGEWISTDWPTIAPEVLWGIAFFIVGPTFISYLLLPLGQTNLRPTVTAMYNYVQPIVATIAAIISGMGRFTLANAAAIALVFTGVFLVTKSKSRADLEKESDR
ncbi:MAG: DMT family transporter [[Clostridium] fimetarium]|nr:DMT family transporter [Alistipes timonensis]MCM1405397.1 DMT family transporter [[Clostridium] fimetarium]